MSGAGEPFMVDEFKDAIARTLEDLDRFRAGLKAARHRELEERLTNVRQAFEDGDDRRDILRRFQITHGQLAGWANRGKWTRPTERVADLDPSLRSRYQAARIELPKAAAVRAAREAVS